MEKNRAKNPSQDVREAYKKQLENNRKLAKIIHKNQEKELLKLREQLWEIQEGSDYALFFNQCARPLQIFVSLEKTYQGTRQEQEALSELVTEPVRREIKSFGGVFFGGRLMLSGRGEFDAEKAKAEIQELTKAQLSDYLLLTKSKVKSGQMTVKERDVLWETGTILELLLEMEPDQRGNAPGIRRLAGRMREALENNGIYPMFREDIRLENREKLTERFIPVEEGMPVYPGLFLKGKDGPQVLGAHVGTYTGYRRK